MATQETFSRKDAAPLGEQTPADALAAKIRARRSGVEALSQAIRSRRAAESDPNIRRSRFLDKGPQEEASFGEHVVEFGRSVPRGFVQAAGGVAAAAQSLGERVAGTPYYAQLGPDFQRQAVELPNEMFPPNPALEGSLTQAVGSGLGQAGFYALSGATTAGLGPLGAAGGAAATGALGQFSGGYFDAVAHGADEETAFQSGLANAPAGLLEGIPLGGQVARVLGRANAATGGGLVRGVVRALTEGAEGAGQETVQRAWADEVAKHVAAYDPDRKILEDAFKQDALPGFLVSALLSGTSQALARGVDSRETASASTAPKTGVTPSGGPENRVDDLGSKSQQQTSIPQGQEFPGFQPSFQEGEVAPRETAQEAPGSTQAAPEPQATPEAVTSQAGSQEEQEPRGPRFHEMTPEEMEVRAESLERAEDSVWKRIMPDASAGQIAAAKRKLDRGETEEVDSLLAAHGIEVGSPDWSALFGEDPEELRRVASEVTVASEASTPEQVASDIGGRIGDIQSGLNKLKAGEPLSPRESTALAVARAASQAAEERGIAREDILKAVSARLADLGHTRESVAELYGEFFGLRPAPTDQPGKAQANLPPAPARQVSEPSQATSQPLPIEPAKLQEEVSKRVTSLRNAVGEAEAERLGVELPETERHTWKKANEEAAAKLSKDPLYGHRLVESWNKNPRPLTDTDQFVVLREKARVLMLRDELEKQIIAAHAAGDTLLTDELDARVKRAQDDLASILKVARAFGSESGRSLSARKADILEDWSLAMMEQRKSAANKGAPLTTEQQEEVRELHRKLEEAERRFDKYVQEVEQREKKRAAERKQQRDLKREVRDRRREASKKRIDSLFHELASVTRSANVGIDPKVLRIVRDLAIEHIKLGVNEFAAWADTMVQRAGEGIRPYLKDAWDEAQKSEDPALKRAKARMRAEAEKLQKRIDEGDFNKADREPVQLDEEGYALKAEVEKLRREFQRGLERDRLKNRSIARKVLETTREVAIDLPKAFITGFDLSAVLRQGGVLTLARPGQAARAMRKMFQAIRSEQRALEIDVWLRNRPLAKLGDQAGLDLTDLDGTITDREEAIKSQLSDKIPGLPASNRAFATFLNVQRALAFDSIVEANPGMTVDEARAVANFVNVATGRGNVAYVGKYLHALGAVLWSPRLLFSRFQLLMGQPFYRGTARTRKIVARQYARSLIGIATVYALASLIPGIDLEEDPRSSDFGKLRIGNTTVDPLAGLAQVTTFVARQVTGETKRTDGRVVSLDIEDRGYKGDSRLDVVERFARTKLSPTVGLAFDIADQENVVGEPTTPANIAKNMLVPLSMQDIADVIQEHGYAAGTAMSIASLLGWGVQTYERNK